jgi:hypothetical protein
MRDVAYLTWLVAYEAELSMQVLMRQFQSWLGALQPVRKAKQNESQPANQR